MGVPRIVFLTESTLEGLGLQCILGSSADVRIAHRTDPGWLAVLRGQETDLLVVDGRPTELCLAACRIAREALPDLPVLVVACDTDESSARAALEVGARGYVCGDSSPDDIIAAVRWVADGQAVIDPRITAQLLIWLESGDDHSDPLSSRELEVLSLVSRGESNKRIARQLGITEHTVKTYLKRASKKLGCHTRASAAATAVKNGWI